MEPDDLFERYKDVESQGALRVAEMLDSNTEPSQCTMPLRRLAAGIIRELVVKVNDTKETKTC